jgi:stage V sporulation protein R
VFELLDFDRSTRSRPTEASPSATRTGSSGWSTSASTKTHTYGLGKIYEMVINNDPCYAYLLNDSTMVDHKTVIAHVYGHCDFFKNNIWFARTNRRMMDGMANHATRLRRYIDRFGFDEVEAFLDVCLSIGSDRPALSIHARLPHEHTPTAAAPALRGGRSLPGQAVHGPVHQPAERLEKEPWAKLRRDQEKEESRPPKRSAATCCCSTCSRTPPWRTGSQTSSPSSARRRTTTLPRARPRS